MPFSFLTLLVVCKTYLLIIVLDHHMRNSFGSPLCDNFENEMMHEVNVSF